MAGHGGARPRLWAALRRDHRAPPVGHRPESGTARQAGASAREAASLTDLAATPLVVLTAGVGNAPDWSTKQDRLAALSTNTSHRTVEGAAHAELVANEADAAKTTEAILDVVAAVRSNQPLAR